MALLLLTFLIASCSVVLCGVVKAWWSIWWKPKSLERQLRKQGIRGNPYKLLFGDIKDEVKMIQEARSKPLGLTHQIVPRVFPFAHQTVQKYGKVSLVWIGTTPSVIIGDPDMIREVLSNKSGHFSMPYVNPVIKLLALGISSLEGEEWAKRRRMITPAFHLEKLKGMVPVFSASCYDLIKRWEKLVDAEGSCELDVWPEFQNLAGDIISKTAFGSSYEEGKRVFQLQKEQITLIIEAASTLFLPCLRFLPTQKNKRMVHIYGEIKSILRTLIHKKQHLMEVGESCNDDLLGLLLQATDSNNLQEHSNNLNKHRISIEDIIEECKLFYFAGHETSSVWLTWTMIVLAMHPSWQEKAREEVLQTCGEKIPEYETISHLKIVTMILYEVLRLYPPVICLIRQTCKKIKLGDMTLPAGINLLLPTILFHHDPTFWGGDVEEFNPERFSQGVSKASRDQNAFFPFGWGPRICLGQNFAMIEAKMALSMMLQHFSFELAPSYVHAPCTGATLQPQHGAQIILHKL